ncbi:hypothetical protein [Pleionea sp. CnH1-48]|uniref:hypothetical protein n=1 Tax=Pleionea sp. CnH1-48 TaxID=2954494 RepID=UPI0020980368|nr:hypothetical protein [Pleionea sp. CnH1-48]MCO7223758.1 hypothetical protein [Pleionea sp. CnH1-48]
MGKQKKNTSFNKTNCTTCNNLKPLTNNWIATEAISQNIEQVIKQNINKGNLTQINENGLEITYQCKSCQTQWYFKFSDGPNRGHFSQ